MPRVQGKSDVELLAKELSAVARLKWSDPDQFDFGRLEILARLLALTEEPGGVRRLRLRLAQLAQQVRAEEEKEPREHGNSYASAWIVLLALDEQWQGEPLKRRREWLCQRWLTKFGTPVETTDSFRTNQEPRIYKELAAQLLAAEGDETHPGRRRTKRKRMPPVEPASWPVKDRRPADGTEIVVLVAAPALRAGPASALVKLVREFEPHWRATNTMIYALEGSYKEIWRAGLLHDYADFVPLPAGFFGGLVHATEIVVAAAEAKLTTHVVYFIDPHDTSALYPATSSLKRECILTYTAFLTTYQGAARWFRLEWARRVADGESPRAQSLLVPRPRAGFPAGRGLEDEPGELALAAHDRNKRAMMDFADSYSELIEHYFPKRWATRVTGHLLNGGSVFDEEYAQDILYDVKREAREPLMDRIEDKTFAWEVEERERGPGTVDWIRQLTRGRQGGVVQLARKVLKDECNTVIFFQDAETPREHDMEIQVLDRAAQLADKNCLLLYDPRSAGRWAENVSVCLDRDRTHSATTLTEAYRRVFGVELVLAHAAAENPPDPPPSRRTQSDDDDIWDRITSTAASYLVGLLAAAKRRHGEHGVPVRLGFPWGGAIRDVLGRLRDDAAEGPLAEALGLHEFVDRRPATELYNARGYARGEGRWPPLSGPGAPLRFGRDELRVISTVGLIGSRDRSLESHALVDLAVSILGGEAVPYLESAFVFREGREDPFRRAPERDWENLDVLILTAAPLKKRPLTGALATALPTDLAVHYEGAEGAVGTIYLEQHGDGIRQREHESYSQAGIKMDQIRTLRKAGGEVVLISGADMGDDDHARVRAARAALKARLASAFVTDETFAWAVLTRELPQLAPSPRGN